MSLKLRDLIRKVRACKTAAEERSVIAKESAMIRTAIREEQAHFRHRNVAKLLFMHMLGYPTHFGQLECMKLVASPHFPEKRIGYLGMMLLLSEQADVLMLSTNALKNDLTSDNKFIAGLALCCIGNLATADMSRDLVPEVDKHLQSTLPYLRKKANLAMARCLSKCPEMVEDFAQRIAQLLNDKSHGVLITVLQLMTQVITIDYHNAIEEGEDPFATECRVVFLGLIPNLTKMLRNLLGSGYSPDHDVAGISDPFLQVQILTLLRLLGINNDEACETMNDVLAQVASNTDTSKNAGNAILYECVQTIMGTNSDDALRVLAVNILGRFLLNRDNNIRYVALNTLAKCIVESNKSDSQNTAMSALQRHRTTVVDCLRDPDVSIRQRALELIYHLVNASNVKDLTSELLGYLVLCPREHRADICTRILKILQFFSPDDRWRVDTLITTLVIAGREANMDFQNTSVIYISRAAPDIQAFATHKLFKAVRDDDGGSQVGLANVGIWCVGEFGDMLLRECTYTDDGVPVTFMPLDASSVVDVLEGVTRRHSCPEYVKHRALTAFVKLSNRFTDPVVSSRLQELIERHRGSRSLELQVRSCEYNALLNASKGIASAKPRTAEDDIFGMSNGDASNAVSDGIVAAANEALSRMPAVDLKVLEKRFTGTANEFAGNGGDVQYERPKAAAPAASNDLLDIFGGDSTPAAVPQNGTNGGKSDLDLLSDIFAAPAAGAPAAVAPAPSSGGYDPFSSNPPATSAPAPAVNPLDLFGAPPAAADSAPVAVNDIFGVSPAAPSQPATADLFGATPVSTPVPSLPAAPRVAAVNHSGLEVEFECSKPDAMNQQKSLLLAHFKNTAGAPIHGMNLQVAVPKYIKMEMEPPTATTIPPSNSNVTQKITVTNSMMGTKNLILKVKVSFTVNGQKIDHMATCSGFPSGQY